MRIFQKISDIKDHLYLGGLFVGANVVIGSLVALVLGGPGVFLGYKDDRKPTASVSRAGYIAVGDVTGDGKKDIIYSDNKGVFYLENLGDERFGQPVKAGETGPLSNLDPVPPVSVGDVTGDGLEDIVLGNKAGIFVLQNLGEGQFKPLE